MWPTLTLLRPRVEKSRSVGGAILLFEAFPFPKRRRLKRGAEAPDGFWEEEPYPHAAGFERARVQSQLGDVGDAPAQRRHQRLPIPGGGRDGNGGGGGIQKTGRVLNTHRGQGGRELGDGSGDGDGGDGGIVARSPRPPQRRRGWGWGVARRA